MSEVQVTGLLNFAFSFIRTKGAEKLQYGGLADQRLRGWIIDELDNITSKLDAISRKDLCASISFLQNGIQLLTMSVGMSSERENSDEKPSTSEFLTAVKSSTETKPAPQSVTVTDAVELASAIKPRVESSERLQLAKEFFKDAGTVATGAFYNTALSIEDRISACKLRFASAILENLKDPEIAASDCLQYLKELHGMPAVKEIFSLLVKFGIKSFFKIDTIVSRYEIADTVAMINLILADFISKSTKWRMAVFDWPMIECGKKLVHPIHFYHVLSNSSNVVNLERMKMTPPWDIVKLEDDQILMDVPNSKDIHDLSRTMAFTKNGDLVCVTEGKHGPQKLIRATGELQSYYHSALEGNTGSVQPGNVVICIAVDEDDTLYVVSQDDKGGLKLSVYSADGTNVHHSTLTFLTKENGIACGMRIMNSKDIVIVKRYSSCAHVYVCNKNGKLISKFTSWETNCFPLFSFFVKSNDEIVLMEETLSLSLNYYHRLSTYTQGGKLQGTVKFRSHSFFLTDFSSIFYNHVTETFIGQVIRDKELGESAIEYSSAKNRKCSYLLYDTNFPETGALYNYGLKPVCHINGTVALVGKRHVIFLKDPSST